MQLRLARFHSVGEFEDLVGIRPAPPGHTGDTVSTWRLRPGMCPPVFGLTSWDAPGLVGLTWDAARPVVWDVDLSPVSGRTCAVFASGIHVLEADGAWRYYEAPGQEPVILAAAYKASAFSIIGRASDRFPVVIPADKARDWITRTTALQPWLRELPTAGRRLFRGWPVAPPDAAPDDGAELVRPVYPPA